MTNVLTSDGIVGVTLGDRRIEGRLEYFDGGVRIHVGGAGNPVIVIDDDVWAEAIVIETRRAASPWIRH